MAVASPALLYLFGYPMSQWIFWETEDVNVEELETSDKVIYVFGKYLISTGDLLMRAGLGACILTGVRLSLSNCSNWDICDQMFKPIMTVFASCALMIGGKMLETRGLAYNIYRISQVNPAIQALRRMGDKGRSKDWRPHPIT